MSETIFGSANDSGQAENPSIEVDTLKSDFSVSDNKEPDLLFWGANERNILFIIQNPEVDYFSVEAEDAFLKTLAALKLSIQDVAVFNRGKVENTLNEINDVLKPKICIYSEGENEAKRNIFNKLTKVDDITCLYTYSFEEMLTDIDKKRSFWNAIKGITII